MIFNKEFNSLTNLLCVNNQDFLKYYNKMCKSIPPACLKYTKDLVDFKLFNQDFYLEFHQFKGKQIVLKFCPDDKEYILNLALVKDVNCGQNVSNFLAHAKKCGCAYWAESGSDVCCFEIKNPTRSINFYAQLRTENEDRFLDILQSKTDLINNKTKLVEFSSNKLYKNFNNNL